MTRPAQPHTQRQGRRRPRRIELLPAVACVLGGVTEPWWSAQLPPWATVGLIAGLLVIVGVANVLLAARAVRGNDDAA